MSILFADIYEAIQKLRIQKGVCEKDILNYIEERVGGCLKAANFMKTIRTLQKLVDDGILMKKGKRFVFSSDPSQPNEEEEEDEESDENEEEPELDMSDDECDQGEQNECEEEGGDEDDDDEDDDDDDDDDDDEDDDDDDDDEDDNECDEKENLEKEISSKDDQNPTAKNSLKSVNKEKIIMSPKKTNDNSSDKSASNFGSGVKCENGKTKNETNNERLLSEETRNLMEQNDDMRRTETIAFCVRDFIDSLYRPKADCQDQEKVNVPDILLQENMDATEIEETGRGKFSVSKKRKLRKKRDQSRYTYRSRSPIKKAKAEKFHSLKRDRSDEVCFWVASNQFLPEPMDADMDIDLEKEIGDVAEYDPCRHRSPADPLPTEFPDGHVSGKESSCSNQDNKKLSPCFERNNEYFLKNETVQIKPSQMDNGANSQSNWFRSEEVDREQENINSFSVEDETNASIERQTSLCSFCDKNEVNT